MACFWMGGASAPRMAPASDSFSGPGLGLYNHLISEDERKIREANDEIIQIVAMMFHNNLL